MQAVACPVCDVRFVVDDDEMDELRRWTDADRPAFAALNADRIWDVTESGFGVFERHSGIR